MHKIFHCLDRFGLTGLMFVGCVRSPGPRIVWLVIRNPGLRFAWLG